MRCARFDSGAPHCFCLEETPAEPVNSSLTMHHYGMATLKVKF